MSKTDGSFSALSFDSPLKMNGSLVEAFFSKHSKKFGAWINGAHICEKKKTVLKDSQNNKIFFVDCYVPPSSNITEVWTNRSGPERANILLKVAVKLEESSDLIGQLEYFVRGILPRDTRKCVTQIANYFRYYSNVADSDRRGDKIPKWKTVFNFTDLSSILILAHAAQCFASGRSMFLFTQPNVAALGILFAELCHEVGLSQELLCVIPMLEAPSRGFSDVLFDKSISLSWGTTMTVFESSDIDSAVEIVTSAAWEQKGLLPWALNQILIQESVYESFIIKLSKKIKKFTWELPKEYNLDESTKKMIAKVDKVLEKATQQGIKHIPMHDDFTIKGARTLFKPVVLLENVPPYFWADLSGGIPTPVITAQSFRTTKEAMSLINNTSSFALSIWCNNITVCNELALASNVSCVWINAFGLLSADVALKNKQNLSCSFLGGLEGFDSNLFPMCPDLFKYDILRFQTKEPQISSEVEKISKLQMAWAKTNKEKKVSCLRAIANSLENKKSQWASLITKEGNTDSQNALEMVEKSIKYIKFAAQFCEQLTDTCSVNSDKTMCLGIREALGVIFVEEGRSSLFLLFVYTVAAATLFGNGVLYQTKSALILAACKEFSSVGIPVLTVEEAYYCDPKYETIKAIWRIAPSDHAPSTAYDRPNVCWDGLYDSVELIAWDERQLNMRLSNVKNIWSTFGETFAN